MLVSAADKLHNLRSIHADYRQLGDAIYNRFNTPEPKPENVLWYYASVRDIYGSQHSPADLRRMPIVQALSELLDQLGHVRPSLAESNE